jgi:hypothetical protein
MGLSAGLGHCFNAKWNCLAKKSGSKAASARPEPDPEEVRRVRRVEARDGIEPPNKGSADLYLTVWVPRRLEKTTVSLTNDHTFN